VAGTIGAQGDNGTGITGVNWDVSIMALRALNSAGTGTNAGLAAAFTYAGNNGADVVNASLSGAGFSQAMLDAINGAPDTLFVAAAGNERIDNNNHPRFPCNYAPANNICVGATDSNDMLTNFSNRGSTHVDLAAPGVNVLSALPNFESQFSETFSDGTGWTGRWNTGGPNNTWGLQLGALADSPDANYLNNTNSFVRKTVGVNTTGQKGCRLDYTLNIDTDFGLDFLHVDASTNGTTFTAADSLTGSTEGLMVDVSSRLGSLDNQTTAHFGFRLRTDATETASGIVIDNVDLICIEPGYDGTNEFGFLNGTSMATPHVAGAAALLLDVDPTATVAELRSALLHGVDPKATLAGQVATGGRLNLKNSVDLIAGDNDPPDAVNDSLSTEEDTLETIDVLANDTDPNGDDLTVAVSTDGDDGLVDCTTGGDCTYTPDAGFSGTDDFTYIISDGNGGSDPATVDVTVTPGGDQTPPNTKINKGPKGKIKKKNAKKVRFRFSSTEAGSTFKCKRNNSPWKNCSSPKTYRNLPRGKHTFRVRATDAAGNTDPTPAKRSFKIVRN
jgi:subtilisin family serine protease